MLRSSNGCSSIKWSLKWSLKWLLEHQMEPLQQARWPLQLVFKYGTKGSRRSRSSKSVDTKIIDQGLQNLSKDEMQCSVNGDWFDT